VPSLSDETVTIAYLRSVTDEDAEAQLQHPTLWAYVVRDPTGAICSHGHGKTRKECEESAIVHAAERADEAWPESRMWLARKWSFLIWPPKNATRQRDRTIDLKEPRAPEVMNIHQKFPNFRCGLAPLVERFSRIRACSLTIASCSTTKRVHS
jgi:hypothetical protein